RAEEDCALRRRGHRPARHRAGPRRPGAPQTQARPPAQAEAGGRSRRRARCPQKAGPPAQAQTGGRSRRRSQEARPPPQEEVIGPPPTTDMIRVITIDEYDPKQLEKFCKILYTAFAVGSEHSGSVRMPDGITEPIDAPRFLETAQGVRAYADDKLLYLTSR